MKELIVLKFLLVFHFVRGHEVFDHPNWPQYQDICGISYADRIIGGIKADLGAYPWIAHIGIRGKLEMSNSLRSKRVLIEIFSKGCRDVENVN